MTPSPEHGDGHETLLLFVRYPEAGRVKTRLIPALGADGAAALYERMAEAIARRIGGLRRPGLRRVALVEPAQRLAAVGAWLGDGFAFDAQVEGDLGVRLGAAFAAAFEDGARRVVAIGSDCLDLTPELLGEAFDALDRMDAVVGPALDGGYYLIGLRRPIPAAFAAIPWSSADTLATTLDRLQDNGASVHLLRPLRDLDTPADLDALLPRWGTLLRSLDEPT
jgi:rSAM/selenodomain-associated transferase 1